MIKKTNLIIFFSVSFCLIFSNAKSNTDVIDSLEKQVESSTGINRLQALYELAWEYFYVQTDSALVVAHRYYHEAEKTGDDKKIAKGYYLLANANYYSGNYTDALRYFEKAKQLAVRSGNRKMQYEIYNGIGLVLIETGKIKEAIDMLFLSLEWCEKTDKSVEHLSNVYNNIGLAFSANSDYIRSLEYFVKALDAEKSRKNPDGLLFSYLNVGGTYANMGDYKEAITYFDTALQLALVQKNYLATGSLYLNYAIVYQFQNDNSKAEEYYLKAIGLKKETNDTKGRIELLNSYGHFQIEKKNFRKAAEICKQAYDLANSSGIFVQQENICDCLHKAALSKGDFRNAYRYFRESIQARDSLINIEHASQLARRELTFEFDKKTTADSIKSAEEKLVAQARIAEGEAKLKQEKTMKYTLYGGLTLVLVFSVFIFNRFRITRRQKTIIELKEKETAHQKEIIEEKQKEIIDSINYAKRLQQAILAPETVIRNHFPDSFLFFRPKDIVAGDFYFFEITDTHIFYAACDCTGHGVPGAMMSVVCSNALTRSVKEFGLTDPGKILDKTRKLILETFQKSGEEVKDGMDISLCCFKLNASEPDLSTAGSTKVETLNTKLKTVYWAGANNPLWLIEEGKIKEIKADKQPIGKSDNLYPFTSHFLELNPGSWIFLFTDGFADQFGGPKKKKFKYSNLQKLLLEIYSETHTLTGETHISGDTFYKKLEEEFNRWKGDLEQIDDVCIIGVRI